jgi:hypothetical protein
LKKTRSHLGKMLVAVLILFAFGAAFMPSTLASYNPAAATIPAATVFLTPSRISGTAGTYVNITADISNINLMMGYQVGLIWSNTTVASCTKVMNGSMLNQIPDTNYAAAPGSINNAKGVIVPYAWSMNAPYTMNGSGGMVIFTFHILTTGWSDVHPNGVILITRSVTAIPFNTVDYFTTVAGGVQYFTRLQGNPINSKGQGGFSAMSVTSPSKVAGRGGNMTFRINGTSTAAGTFAYFNATIPNKLMNCTTAADWMVELGGAVQSGVLVSTGTQNATISLSSTSDPSFAYSSTLTLTINILSDNSAVPEFASMFSSILLATLLVLATFAAALFTVTSRSRKPRG